MLSGFLWHSIMWITHCSKPVVVRCAFVFFETEESGARAQRTVALNWWPYAQPADFGSLSWLIWEIRAEGELAGPMFGGVKRPFVKSGLDKSGLVKKRPAKAAPLSPTLLCMEANEKPSFPEFSCRRSLAQGRFHLRTNSNRVSYALENTLL
jgi:hypothetical protein